MSRAFNFERAAATLVDAAYVGDRRAAEKSGVSIKSVQVWRKRLDEDEVFRQFFLTKKLAYESEWSNRLPAAILKAIAFLEESFDKLDKSDPEAVKAAAGAYKLLTDTAIAKQVLDARAVQANALSTR